MATRRLDSNGTNMAPSRLLEPELKAR